MWWSKILQRAKPERYFAEPEPPEQDGEQLPFIKRRICDIKSLKNNFYFGNSAIEAELLI